MTHSDWPGTLDEKHLKEMLERYDTLTRQLDRFNKMSRDAYDKCREVCAGGDIDKILNHADQRERYDRVAKIVAEELDKVARDLQFDRQWKLRVEELVKASRDPAPVEAQ